MKKSLLYIAAVALIGLQSCKPDLDTPEPSSGSADFSNYVAVGNSLTAGYADGTLYKSGQEVAFTKLMGEQMMKAGGREFKTPFMDNEAGMGEYTPTGQLYSPRRVMGYSTDCQGTTGLGPVLYSGTDVATNPLNPGNVYANGPYNNYGVPGLKLLTLNAPGYGNIANIPLELANPYFTRIVNPAAPNNSVLTEIVAADPSFFTFWVGNNDVLGYATSGGDQGGESITDLPTFTFLLDQALDSLTANGAKGAIATIPNILGAPYFQTVPAKGLPIADSTTLGQLNQLYGIFTPGVMDFSIGANYWVLEETPGTYTQVQEGELLLLTTPQDSLRCGGLGSAYQGPNCPLAACPSGIPGQLHLSLAEIDNINTAITGYNAAITDAAAEYDLALVDVNEFFDDVVGGYMVDGVATNATFVTGGAFSLDGIHLTPRGNAILANQFIGSINAKFNSSIPTVNEVDYKGVELP